MECMYCKALAINAEMFVVRKATKPKGAPHRWQKIGFCCESCESEGKPIDIECAPHTDALMGGSYGNEI